MITAKCDKCGEEPIADPSDLDGQIWCDKCIKEARDSFQRTLHQMRYGNNIPYRNTRKCTGR